MNPFLLFENILEDGTLTASTELGGYPKENVLDWRTAVPYRWRPSNNTTDQYLEVDLGVGGDAGADTLIIGGHNMESGQSHAEVWYSDNGSTWTLAGGSQFGLQQYLDNIPVAIMLDTVGVHRYWRVQWATVGDVNYPNIPWIGIVTLGRRLELPGLMPDMDIYGEEIQLESVENDFGDPLGANVRYLAKEISINYNEGNAPSVDEFFSPPADVMSWDNHFIPHYRIGRPFWFSWNLVADPSGVWLARAAQRISSTFRSTTANRNLSVRLELRRQLITSQG